MTKKYPAIPQPTADTRSLFETAMAKKQILETLLGQRGTDKSAAAVTWQDLVDMNLITPAQLPGDTNNNTTPQPNVNSNVSSLQTSVSQLQPLLSGTFSGVANVDIVLGTLISSYRAFRIIFTNLGDTADGNLIMRCSTDGGATFDSGANYDWWYDYVRNDATYNKASAAGATSSIVGWGSSNALYTSDFQFDCYNLAGTTDYKKFASYGTLGNTTNLYNFRGSAVYLSATAVNALRFLSDAAGNLSGSYAVFGVL